MIVQSKQIGVCCTVVMYDNNGVICHDDCIQLNKVNQIDLSKLNSGVYTVVFTAGDLFEVRRVVIVR